MGTVQITRESLLARGERHGTECNKLLLKSHTWHMGGSHCIHTPQDNEKNDKLRLIILVNNKGCTREVVVPRLAFRYTTFNGKSTPCFNHMNKYIRQKHALILKLRTKALGLWQSEIRCVCSEG